MLYFLYRLYFFVKHIVLVKHAEISKEFGVEMLGTKLIFLSTSRGETIKRHGAGERLAKLVQVGKPQQVFFGEESTNFSGWVEIAMPKPNFIAVGNTKGSTPCLVRNASA